MEPNEPYRPELDRREPTRATRLALRYQEELRLADEFKDRSAEAAEHRLRANETFNEIVSLTMNQMKSTAYTIDKNVAIHREVIQNTYIKAYRGMEKYKGTGPFEAWLTRILANEIWRYYDSQNRRNRHHVYGEQDEHLEAVADDRVEHDPILSFDNIELAQEISDALKKLPMTGRKIFILHHVHLKSHEEIGEMLGITATASKIRLSRALAAFRKEHGPRRPKDL